MNDNSTNSQSQNEKISKLKMKDKHEVSFGTQKFILQMCWAQHDAQWFLKTKKEFGIKEGNQLNQKVLFSMGKIEARNVMNALNIERGSITTMPGVFKIMNTFMDVLFPKIMKFKFVIRSDREGLGIVKKCFIWEMVRKSKAESEYECACNFRHRGWLEAVGVKGEIIPVTRISDGDDICEFRFVLDAPK